MDDAVTRYRAASEANDIDAVMSTLSDEIEVVSPIAGRMVFRGKNDVRFLLEAVYGTLNGLRWTDEVGDRRLRLVVGEGKAGPAKVGDAMVFELADDGRIRRIRPHLKPWLGLTVFALLLGPKVARRPSVVLRALRSKH